MLLGVAAGVVAIGARLLFPSAFAGLSVGLVAAVAAGLPFYISWQYTRWLAVALDRYEAFVLPPAVASALVLVLCAVGAAVDGERGMIVGIPVAYAITAAFALVDAVRRTPHEAAPGARSGPRRCARRRLRPARERGQRPATSTTAWTCSCSARSFPRATSASTGRGRRHWRDVPGGRRRWPTSPSCGVAALSGRCRRARPARADRDARDGGRHPAAVRQRLQRR
ncbi:MAG: hypothetical protein R2736_21670 [Solirubrobacterales bacterium]